MKQSLDWSDLRLFLSVAENRGLRAAADPLGISPATLSRRITAFERALDRKLFNRGARGYTLTSDGQQLANVGADVLTAMATVERWAGGQDTVRRVRITAGDWTMLLLLRHLHAFIDPKDKWVPEYLGSNARLDIARREVDIGIRNKRPTEPWLAARQIGFVDYAAYVSEDAAEDCAWIGSCGDGVLPPASRWVEQHQSDDIGARVSSPQLGLPLVLAGAGKLVMTRFIGDTTPGLRSVSDSIPELRTEQWLVAHQDERDHPPVRAALTAIAEVLQRHSQTD